MSTVFLERLKQAPFNLDDAAVKWVAETIEQLSPEERIAQLFNIALHGPAEQWPEKIASLKPGGVTRFFSADGPAERSLIKRLQADADVPLLVSADLEGSRMSLAFGTIFPNPLALAAVDDVEETRNISRLMAREAKAIGVNWSFTPVLDINAAFRSPIVATRGFGSDLSRIRRHAFAQTEVLQQEGLAACVKHWPGEGYDDRDQHLVTTINPLSVADWDATFGVLYRDAIQQGVLSVMSAHIAFPAFVRSIDPNAREEAFLPASLSPVLNIDLLRERLGFNGLIVSDASEMGGILSIMDAATSKVELLKAGCDMVLFTDDLQGDVGNIMAAISSGYLRQERVDDALSRVLALKAALGLHHSRHGDEQDVEALVGSISAQEAARKIFARAPTLVKDLPGLFPLSLERHKRVLLITGNVISPIHGAPLTLEMPQLLRSEGFEVTLYSPDSDLDYGDYDLVLFALAEETLLTRGRIFLNWLDLMGRFGRAMARSWHSVPTALLSFGYPYYLYDAPRMPTYVNAYSTTVEMQKAVIDCMLGREPFSGTSPVDPFCGLPDAHF